MFIEFLDKVVKRVQLWNKDQEIPNNKKSGSEGSWEIRTVVELGEDYVSRVYFRRTSDPEWTET